MEEQTDPAACQRRLTERAAGLLEAAGAAHLLVPAIDRTRRAVLERAAASGTGVAGPSPHPPRRERAGRDVRSDLSAPYARGLLSERREQIALGISRQEQHAYRRQPQTRAVAAAGTPDAPLISARTRAELLIAAGLGAEVRTRQQRDLPMERRQRAHEKQIGSHGGH